MASYKSPENTRRLKKETENPGLSGSGKNHKMMNIDPYDRIVPIPSTVSASPVGKNKSKGFTNPKNQRSDFLKTSTNVETEDSISELLLDLSLTSTGKEENAAPIVVYYAWFFKEDVCAALKEISEAYIRQCYFTVPQFERFLTSACEKNGRKDPLTYYKYPSKKRKLRNLPEYHVTTKFCGRENPTCEEYWPQVAHLVGSSSPLHIIGLFFTEKTCGFRIKLSEHQKQIFDERNTKSTSSSAASTHLEFVNESVDATQAQRSILSRGDDLHGGHSFPKNHYSQKQKRKKSTCKEQSYEKSQYHPDIFVASQEKDFSPSNSRAHITVGTGPFVHAVQTGDDLKDLINLEARSSSAATFHTDYVLENGDVLRQFGRFGDAFILYLSNMFITNGVFNFKE